MKRFLLLVIALLIATPLAAETRSRYMVKMRHPLAMTNLSIVRDAAEVAEHSVRTFANFDFVGVDLTEAEAEALRKSPDVSYLSRVVERHIEIEGFQSGQPPKGLVPVENVSRFSKAQTIPYGIDLVRTREVWPATRGGHASINVAVIDTGIDYTHPDLMGRYVGGYDVFSKTEDPMDDHGHGTHVSGTIAAIDNQFGVVGMAPEVKLWAVKVLRANGSGTDETVAAGVDWVISKKKEIGGNWIISLSLGAAQSTDTERLAFTRAIDEGFLIVAAAGNRSTAHIDSPAVYQGVLAISAIDSNSEIAEFSSYGSGVAFAGPGVNVISTVPPGVAEAQDIETESGAITVAESMEGSAKGDVTAAAVVCGEGYPQDFPTNIAGKIALIRRSTLVDNFRFRDKVTNAMNAGAVAVVIMGNDGRVTRGWTLFAEPSDRELKWPVVVGLSQTDGDAIVEKALKEKLTVSNRDEIYTAFNGTSMATPHVSGAAALAWSLVPTATAADVVLAMKLSADDLGKPGYDDFFGYGRVNAIAAAWYLAPGTFGVPPPPPLNPKRKRQGH